jgi:uncharacterized protein DUF4231
MGSEPNPDAERAREVTLARLEDQINWYDRKSANSRIWHLRLKIGMLLSAGAIPFSAAIGAHAYVGGVLGVIVVVIEGLQQLFQFHTNWVSYRGTCESLKHEKYLFLALAGPYATAASPQRMLAERVEGTVSVENAKWVAQETRPEKKDESRP